MRAVLLLLAPIIAIAPASTQAADVTVSGTIALVKPGSLVKGLHKGAITLPSSADGAFLRLFDTANQGAGDDTYSLPAGQWKGLGTPPGAKGFLYKGAGSAADPCKVVLIRSTVIKYLCKGVGVALAPPVVGDLDVVLNVGDRRYCARFGGTTVKNDATQLKRKGAAAPAGCPFPAEPQWTLGEQQVLLPNGALGGLCYFPDEAMVRVPGIPQLRLLTWAAKCRPGSAYIIDDPTTMGTYLFEGPDIEHLQSARLVLGRGGPGEFDNGYVGICGLHRHTDGRLYGFYHAEDQEGLPPIPGSGGIPGYYASVGGAVSDDDGESWQKLGRVITSNKPKEWTYFPGQAARGAAVMSAVADPNGRYLYAYWAEQSGVDANDNYVGEQVAMARADLSEGAPTPGQWRKYLGGDFVEPGLGGRSDVVLSVLRLHPEPANATQPHVTYSAYLRRYVMVVGVIDIPEFLSTADAERSGMYMAFSDDAVTWSAPQLLIRDWPVALVGKPVSWEANILWDDDSGQRGWLVYGYSPSWGTVGHYMVGRRIEFQ